MTTTAAITVGASREEVEREWQRAEHGDAITAVSFRDAPGDRGTEIHVDVEAGKFTQAVGKLTGSDPVAHAKDELRRFKQLIETGVISRSDAAPEGEALERKLKQRPAQPLEEPVAR